MMPKIQGLVAVAAALVLLAQHGDAFQRCLVKAENGTEIGEILCEGQLVCCKEDISRCCNASAADIPPGSIPVSVKYRNPKLTGSDARTGDLPDDLPDDATRDEDMGQVSVAAKKAKLGRKDPEWQKLLDSGTLPLVHELWHDDPEATTLAASDVEP